MCLCQDNPQEAHRPCEDCKKFVYDSRGQKVKEGKGFAKRPDTMPPNCAGCPKGKELGGDPSAWVMQMSKLYAACKSLGVLPAKGGLLDQERCLANAFIELGNMDASESKLYRDAALRTGIGGM